MALLLLCLWPPDGERDRRVDERSLLLLLTGGERWRDLRLLDGERECRDRCRYLELVWDLEWWRDEDFVSGERVRDRGILLALVECLGNENNTAESELMYTNSVGNIEILDTDQIYNIHNIRNNYYSCIHRQDLF